MDFDLEIINEEGDCPDPLFNCIMNAMNSMKEATADKIYQKIQRDGETNYSKPQVDRALASALKYGIFEVRNNRYRVRDDIRDDEDTVYYTLQKNKERTPFRIQEDINEKNFGPKLDPERDNQRFKRLIRKDSQECPHCGRIKRPVLDEVKHKSGKKETRKLLKKKMFQKNQQNQSKEKRELKRKERFDMDYYDKPAKRKKANNSKEVEQQNLRSINWDKYDEILDDFKNERRIPRQKKAYNTTYSETNLIQSSEYSLESHLEENTSNYYDRNRDSRSPNSLKCIDADDDIIRARSSSFSIKSDSVSEKSEISSVADDDDQSQGRTVDSFLESLPCTSRNVNDKVRNEYFNSNDIYDNSRIEQNKGTSDWLECTDEPQSAIIQSNNVLTIEPMDSLAFKSPEQASYIS